MGAYVGLLLLPLALQFYRLLLEDERVVSNYGDTDQFSLSFLGIGLIGSIRVWERFPVSATPGAGVSVVNGWLIDGLVLRLRRLARTPTYSCGYEDCSLQTGRSRQRKN